MSESRAEPAGDPVHAFFRDALLVGGEATRVYLVRHAQSAGNTGEDLTTGDPVLTEVGREQARRLGLRMKGARLDRIYASPLGRTQATARAIADAAGLEFVTKEDLREVTLGQADTDIRELDPEDQARIAERVVKEGTWDAFPGSEGSAASRARIQRVMDEVIGECAGQRIAVVVHAAFIQTYVSMVLGLERDFVFYPFNCSVHSIRARGEQRVIWRLNDISHLSDMKAGWGGIS